MSVQMAYLSSLFESLLMSGSWHADACTFVKVNIVHISVQHFVKQRLSDSMLLSNWTEIVFFSNLNFFVEVAWLSGSFSCLHVVWHHVEEVIGPVNGWIHLQHPEQFALPKCSNRVVKRAEGNKPHELMCHSVAWTSIILPLGETKWRTIISHMQMIFFLWVTAFRHVIEAWRTGSSTFDTWVAIWNFRRVRCSTWNLAWPLAFVRLASVNTNPFLTFHSCSLDRPWKSREAGNFPRQRLISQTHAILHSNMHERRRSTARFWHPRGPD